MEKIFKTFSIRKVLLVFVGSIIGIVFLALFLQPVIPFVATLFAVLVVAAAGLAVRLGLLKVEEKQKMQEKLSEVLGYTILALGIAVGLIVVTWKYRIRKQRPPCRQVNP